MKNIITSLFINITSVLSLSFLHTLGIITGNLLYMIPNKIRFVSFVNIKTCFPLFSPEEQKQLTRTSLIEFCKWLFELGPICKWPLDRLDRLVISRNGIDAVQEILNQGRGVMLITPHYGNWELSALAGAQRFPLTIMYKPPKIDVLHRYMLSSRTRAGATLTGTDHKGLRAVFKALKRGEAIGMLTDQAPKDGNHVYAPFFDQPARTMTLFSKLLRRTNAAVFLSTMHRLPQGRGFALNCVRLDDRILSDRDEIRAATRMNQFLEKLILEDPAQYLWAYKRFKSPSDSEAGGNIYDRSCG